MDLNLNGKKILRVISDFLIVTLLTCEFRFYNILCVRSSAGNDFVFLSSIEKFDKLGRNK